jgi:ABC-type nitrate/sulfonate/bicarbonate transport system permease component
VNSRAVATVMGRRVGPPLLGVAAMLGIWWIIHSQDPVVVPSPSDVASNLQHNFFNGTYLEAQGLGHGHAYWYHLSYTVLNVLIGVSIGTSIGVALGWMSIPVPVIAQLLTPVLATFGAAPIFVAAPFFLIWFGVVASAEIIVVAFYTLVLMYIFSRRASANVSREHVEAAATFGAGRLHLFRHVYAPATIPELIGGFRVALAGAWGLEAIAELLGAQRGIGFLINFYSEVYSFVGMLTLTILLGLAAIICDAVAMIGARALVRWTASGVVA